MKLKIFLAVAFLVLGGCQTPTENPKTPSVPSQSKAVSTVTAAGESTATSESSVQATATPVEGGLPPFDVDLSKPFSDVTLTEWEESTYGGMKYTLPLSQSDLANPHVTDGLTSAERSFLKEIGFVIIHSREERFSSLRQSVDGGQPYFLTVDAAYHALHQNFDDTLKELERQYLRPKMQSVLQSTLAELLANADQWQGTSVEAEETQAIAYLSTALKLFDPAVEVDASVREVVDSQIELIMAAGGWDASTVVPGFTDDYGAYKPVGHYAGDPELENYFRGMTWLGRVHYLFGSKSRVPLFITLALRRATLDESSASLVWGKIHRILDFIVGPSDDAGPLEYSALMDQIYTSRQTYALLADDSLFQDFCSHGEDLPEPQINSLLVLSTKDISTKEKGWRFMGQRFTIDAFVFQNLVSDRVSQRQLPTGLDVMAVFGSSTARNTLTEFKLDDYENYDGQFDMLVKNVRDQPESEWTNRFYTTWLYSFFPLLEPKGEAFPPFMNTAAWGYKEMNSGLGSWAELKHDTILYTKMAEGAGGGGPPGSGPAPAYVEPDPNAFYRMAYAARVLSQGLFAMDDFWHTGGSGDVPIGMLLDQMSELGDKFQEFGDLAVKEIRGDPIGESDYGGLWGCLGWVECSTQRTDYNRPQTEPPPVPIVAAVAGYTDRTTDIILEVGVGYVDRIFVVVPLESKLQIAQGGVFSYYELTRGRDKRLTDQEWREMLLSGTPPALPVWAPKFVSMGGQSTRWTIFRIGDWYQVTQEGEGVNLRQGPSTSAAVLSKLSTGFYINIIDGPVQADGYTWWKIDNSFQGGNVGWVVENQEWYERV